MVTILILYLYTAERRDVLGNTQLRAEGCKTVLSISKSKHFYQISINFYGEVYSRGPAIVRSGTRLSSSPFLPLLSLFATLPASTFTKFGSQIVNGKITNCQRQNCRACLNQPWMIPITAMALTLSSHAKTKRAIASGHKIPWPNCLQLCHINFNSTRLMDQDASFFP